MMPFLLHLSLLLTIHSNILLKRFSLLFLLFLILLLFLLSYYFLKCLWVIIINIFIDTCLKSLHQLLLYFLFNVCRYQSFSLSNPVPLFCLFFYWNQLLLTLHSHFSHLNQHLPQFCQPLFAFMNNKRRPINKILIYLFQSFVIIFIQFYFLPELIRQVCSLSCFHIKIAKTFLLFDSCILRISKRTGTTITQTCQIVLIFAKVLRISFHSK